VSSDQLVQILHGVGFLTGAALYAMLLSMVLPSVRRASAGLRKGDALAIVTATLGLVWNVGALALVANPEAAPISMAIAYAALGLLPAVFIQVAVGSWRGRQDSRRLDRWICVVAYVLGGGAALLQLAEAVVRGDAPSPAAFRLLALGFVVLVPVMVVAAPPEARRSGSALWVLAVAIFAISAWHLGQHRPGHEGWSAVVLGHHASIPLALAILWLDFRFALADIFLKRALALLVLVAGVVGIYLGLTGPHLVHRTPAGAADARWAVLVLALRSHTQRFQGAGLFPFEPNGTSPSQSPPCEQCASERRCGAYLASGAETNHGSDNTCDTVVLAAPFKRRAWSKIRMTAQSVWLGTCHRGILVWIIADALTKQIICCECRRGS